MAILNRFVGLRCRFKGAATLFCSGSARALATPMAGRSEPTCALARPEEPSESGGSTASPYRLEPILPHFGAFVTGFSLDGSEPLPETVVNRIKDDMKQHRVLVFKGQGQISGARQVQISRQLGQIESTFYKHPRSPHPDIFRVSNDESEGCTNVGRTGWHIDGTFQEMPFKYQTMHFHSMCEGGETWFVPLADFYEMQDDKTKEKWDKLWMVTGRGQVAHPLVYKHPIRGDTTLMFHCGPPFCSGWAVDDDASNSSQRKVKSMLRPNVVQEELTRLLDEAVDKIGVKMKWDVGDFAINDNLGNCHYAPPGTQNLAPGAGLRILHRTTIAGEDIPTKFDGRQSFLAGF
eukprot:TRINITY_DN74806_c0_g1_i1.p1 TRINITY_DN74806_c0_g1~~TRINITY_DN74806_c0_g1_i1.p1  ORF type:complete len:348 (-),score=41.62 TRINITY_DN74806_c0_g1_i1:152-1195(-)